MCAQPLPADTRLEVWSNDRYEVIVRHHLPSGMTHLSIKRHDRGAVIDWRHLQKIKDSCCGPEREACELYPAASRLVDTSNHRHLWVLPAGQRFPFGYDDRLVMTPEEIAAEYPGARQRPFEPGLDFELSPGDPD